MTTTTGSKYASARSIPPSPLFDKAARPVGPVARKIQQLAARCRLALSASCAPRVHQPQLGRRGGWVWPSAIAHSVLTLHLLGQLAATAIQKPSRVVQRILQALSIYPLEISSFAKEDANVGMREELACPKFRDGIHRQHQVQFCGSITESMLVVR